MEKEKQDIETQQKELVQMQDLLEATAQNHLNGELNEDQNGLISQDPGKENSNVSIEVQTNFVSLQTDQQKDKLKTFDSRKASLHSQNKPADSHMVAIKPKRSQSNQRRTREPGEEIQQPRSKSGLGLVGIQKGNLESVTDLNSYSQANERVGFSYDFKKQSSFKGKSKRQAQHNNKFEAYGMLKPKLRGGQSFERVKEEDLSKKVQYDSRNNQRYDDEDSNYEEEHSDVNIAFRGKSKEFETPMSSESELNNDAHADLKPNQRFKNFNEIFKNLTKSNVVDTRYNIVTCCITYNSRSALTVLKASDREYYVAAYSLETYQKTFEEKIGGLPNSYIKLKEVEQNSTGTNFAIVYLDDGVFKLRVLGDTANEMPEDYNMTSRRQSSRNNQAPISRSNQAILDSELNINQVFKFDKDGQLISDKEKDKDKIKNGTEMNNFTMPINNFPDPYITCCFCTNEIIFVNLFHNNTDTHFQFFYNFKTKEVFRAAHRKMNTNEKNFPYKCFFSEENNEVYSFYRQGESFRIQFDPENPYNYEDDLDDTQTLRKKKEVLNPQKIYDKDLGQMYLINGTALIARSSSKVLFFKLERDEFTGEQSWKNYFTIQNRGFIYFIKGNKRIQVTTEQNIYFYLIDPETFLPTLENVMFNFMKCDQMMFGSKVKYGITYKNNSCSFEIYRRKYEHNFQVNAVSKNLDGSRGLPIETMDAFLISQIDKIKFYDMKEFYEIKECEIQIPLLVSKEREPNQIISMQVSDDQNFLAVISGKNLIMNEQKPNQLFIFQRFEPDFRSQENDCQDQFSLIKRIVIKDKPEFNKICMQFIFQKADDDYEPDTLIFATSTKLFSLNYQTEEIQDIVTFFEPLTKQPEYFLMNDAQDVSIVASQEDSIYYNHITHQQIDIDDEFKISAIKEIIYDHEERVFYLLANKHHSKLGLFLIKFSERQPQDKKHKFFLKYKNKLEISDADIAVLKNPEKNYKELIISYKTIFVNTYTVKVIDISMKDPWPLYSHESFQLWESQVTGFFLEKTLDFVTINREGINILSLDSIAKKSIQHANGQEKMIHTLESANYLKIDPKNLIQFQFAGDEKIISIVQQYWKKNMKQGHETEYENIYNIRIHDITLRELLLFQSLYVCNTLSDILQLVLKQPLPSVFFKSFLELDGANMTSILSFDSRSLKHLLKDENKQFFSQEFPMFYKNKIVKNNKPGKYFYRSAIDMALRNNQVSAVTCINDYIVKYQNNYVSSYLFIRNFRELLAKGIKMKPLIDSEIFVYRFDYDEWPSTHDNDHKYYRPYNGSIFDIRESYRDIFWEQSFKALDDEATDLDKKIDSSMIYKVSYTLNSLSQVSEFVVREKVSGEFSIVNQDVSLMEMCMDADDELELFDSEHLQQVIQFKWDQYTRKIHMVGCLMHFLYVFVIIFYVNAMYINHSVQFQKVYETMLIFGIIYPAWYDFTQLYKAGFKEYFSESQNYFDQLYIWSSVANVISQNVSEFDAFHNKLLMTIILIMQITKTFFYLRIFESLSYIVTMIYRVISDLKVFGLFFTILIVLFSMVFAVIGVANYEIPGDLKNFYEQVDSGEEEEMENMPGEDYAQIGFFWGTLIGTLRIAMGDFDFDPSLYLTPQENYLYWCIWLCVVIMTCIIFLNFIIAEASNSYQEVKDNLSALVNKERASLIAEAESQIPMGYKDDSLFPKYIVVREVEQ